MTIKYKTLQIAALGLGIVGFSVSGISTLARQWDQQTQPDNTRNNKGDNGKNGTTADQQKDNPADRELAKKIRKSIASDSSLSTYAHNIKIIAQDGKVTLKGPVRTEKEKADIEAKAAAVAGAGNVTSEIEVAPPKS